MKKKSNVQVNDWKSRFESATRIIQMRGEEIARLTASIIGWRNDAEARNLRLMNVEASNQQLSKENGKLLKVAREFAEDKERDADTIAILTRVLAKANEGPLPTSDHYDEPA